MHPWWRLLLLGHVTTDALWFWVFTTDWAPRRTGDPSSNRTGGEVDGAEKLRTTSAGAASGEATVHLLLRFSLSLSAIENVYSHNGFLQSK